MKQTLVSEQTVIDEVKKAIVETLGVEEEVISPESSLVRDLGAESLDFLDINYRLEQAFGIKTARHSMIEHIEEMFGEETAIDENGELTERAVQLLRIRFGPDLEANAGMDMDEIANIITVQSMASGVLDILDTLPEKCSSCGNGAWSTEDGRRIKCASCGGNAEFVNGDDLARQWLTNIQETQKIF